MIDIADFAFRWSVKRQIYGQVSQRHGRCTSSLTVANEAPTLAASATSSALSTSAVADLVWNAFSRMCAMSCVQPSLK